MRGYPRFAGIYGALFSFWLGLSVAHSAELYVSQAGNDAHPGTRERPLATLAAARDAVRRLPAKATEDMTIWIAGGSYRLAETLVFGLEDSAAPGHTITYAALSGQRPVISSDFPLSGWQKLTKFPAELPESARGHVWTAPLPAGFVLPKMLYDTQGSLPRARTEPFAHQRKLRNVDPAFTSSEVLVEMPVDPKQVANAFSPAGAEVVVIGCYPWTMNILPVQSYSAESGFLRLAASATYPLSAPKFGLSKDQIWVENTFAGLDAPGKWLVDRVSRRVYLWPRGSQTGEDAALGDIAPSDIVAPRLVELVRVEGKIDEAGPVDVPVRGLCFRGLGFAHGERFESFGATGRGIQHDWERFDYPSAMLRFRGAEDCSVEQCEFRDSGGTGVRFDLHAQRNRVIDCDFYELGGVGILLAGYGPGTKDVNHHNQLVGNHIHHIGRQWWHASAIFVWQSGHNQVARNHLHHLPYSGICVTGRIIWDRNGVEECSRTVRWNEVGDCTDSASWDNRQRFLHGRENLIEGNDIHHVLEVMGDGNGIYVSGTGRGNVVRHNYVHDVPRETSGEAIRCDDDQHETLIERNVVFRFAPRGVGLCSKGRNAIINNIVACPPGKVVTGMISLEGPVTGSRIRRNILYATAPQQPFVGFHDHLVKTQLTVDVVDTDQNLFFNANDPHAADAYLAAARENGRELTSVSIDPKFVDPQKGDFRFQPDSPAWKLGIEPIELPKVRTVER